MLLSIHTWSTYIIVLPTRREVYHREVETRVETRLEYHGDGGLALIQMR